MRHSVVMSKIEDRIRQVQTMVHTVGKDGSQNLFDDRYDILEGDEGGLVRYRGGGLLHSESWGDAMSQVSTALSAAGIITETGASSTTVGGYLGDIAEGWDPDAEYKTRAKLLRSAAMVNPQAAMRVRPLDKPGIARLIEKCDGLVGEEERQVSEQEALANRQTKKKVAVPGSMSKATMEALEVRSMSSCYSGILSSCHRGIILRAPFCWFCVVCLFGLFVYPVPVIHFLTPLTLSSSHPHPPPSPYPSGQARHPHSIRPLLGGCQASLRPPPTLRKAPVDIRQPVGATQFDRPRHAGYPRHPWEREWEPQWE